MFLLARFPAINFPDPPYIRSTSSSTLSIIMPVASGPLKCRVQPRVVRSRRMVRPLRGVSRRRGRPWVVGRVQAIALAKAQGLAGGKNAPLRLELLCKRRRAVGLARSAVRAIDSCMRFQPTLSDHQVQRPAGRQKSNPRSSAGAEWVNAPLEM